MHEPPNGVVPTHLVPSMLQACGAVQVTKQQRFLPSAAAAHVPAVAAHASAVGHSTPLPTLSRHVLDVEQYALSMHWALEVQEVRQFVVQM